MDLSVIVENVFERQNVVTLGTGRDVLTGGDREDEIHTGGGRGDGFGRRLCGVPDLNGLTGLCGLKRRQDNAV